MFEKEIDLFKVSISHAVEYNGTAFEVVPMMASTGQSIGYESLIVIASMSISGTMLLFSLAAITYVVHKRKEYQANAASAVAAAGMSVKSEYSLRTVAEQLDNQPVDENQLYQPQQHGRSLPRANGINGSSYSLRKQIDFGIFFIIIFPPKLKKILFSRILFKNDFSS